MQSFRSQRVTALHVASREGNVAAIRKLASLGANLDKENGASLPAAFCALIGGHLDALWLLLELGAHPDARGEVGCGMHARRLCWYKAPMRQA